jgi:hypothetical protein
MIGTAASARAARAQDRFVDDEAVEPRLRVRAGAGLGVGVLTYPGAGNSTLAIVGKGVNAEVALGLGRGFELGARVGVRLDEAGRGLRADEIARGFEQPTFGTGLSTLANPELGVRWRAGRWRWLEAGAEDRVVVPTPADPNVTNVVGAWASAHAPRIARLDIDVEAALSWQSFATGYVLSPAFGAPVRLWLNVTSGWFGGLIATPRYDVATAYTSSTLEMTTGFVAGYRVRACDASVGAYLLDVVNSGTDRTGAGLRVSCRPGATSR